MNWSYELLVQSLLVLSVAVGATMKSVLGVWLLMEINFVAFIGLASSKFLTKEVVVYFLVQSVGSLGIVMDLALKSSVSGMVVFVCLLLKVGMAPLYAWLLLLLGRLPWDMFWLVSVWQKILPIVMLSFVGSGYFILLLVSMISCAIGSYLMIGAKSTRGLFAASSVYSVGWLGASSKLSSAFVFILWGYGLGLWVVMKALPAMGVGGILNISGVPPFSFFWGKILVLKEVLGVSVLSSAVVLFSAVVSIYCYARLLYSELFKSVDINWFLNFKSFLGGSFESLSLIMGMGLPVALMVLF